MVFRTILEGEKSNFKIDYKDSLFFLGSCFSTNIRTILHDLNFKTISNPFGIVYNPISIFNQLDIISEKRNFSKIDLFEHNKIWSSFSFHSDISNKSSKKVLDTIKNQTDLSISFLKNTNTLFITFGTAWVYENDGKVVANCHKVQNNKFIKKLLSINEIVSRAQLTISKLLNNNKGLNIVFTLSPVRHLRDGFIENNHSKSILHLAIKNICSTIERTSYFPAYEYVIDDLRDYRYYKDDFLHPNELAIGYIQDKFEKTFFSEETIDLSKKIKKLNSSLNHKVKFTHNESFSKFKFSIQKQIEQLEKHNCIDLSIQKERFNQM